MLSRFSRVRLFKTPWTVAHQAPVKGFSKQEYWSGFQCPFLWDLADPGIKPESLTSPALEVDSLPLALTWEANKNSGNAWVFHTPLIRKIADLFPID